MDIDQTELEINEGVEAMIELLRQNPNAIKLAHKLTIETLEEQCGTGFTQEDIDKLENDYIEELALMEILMDKAAWVIYSTMCTLNPSASMLENLEIATLSENEIILAIKHKIIRPIMNHEGFCIDLFMRGMHAATPKVNLTEENIDELIEELTDIGAGLKKNPYSVFTEDDPRLNAEYVLSGIGYDTFDGENRVSEKATIKKTGNVIQLSFDETGVLN